MGNLPGQKLPAVPGLTAVVELSAVPVCPAAESERLPDLLELPELPERMSLWNPLCRKPPDPVLSVLLDQGLPEHSICLAALLY